MRAHALRALALALAIASSGEALAAPAPAETLFIVKFKSGHVIGRAQSLAAQGKGEQARAAVTGSLKRSAPLKGLCFVRFTIGGAETVLRFCKAPAEAAREAASAAMLKHLRANPFVDYADRNVTVDVNAKPH